jgi:hypothetical protein
MPAGEKLEHAAGRRWLADLTGRPDQDPRADQFLGDLRRFRLGVDDTRTGGIPGGRRCFIPRRIGNPLPRADEPSRDGDGEDGQNPHGHLIPLGSDHRLDHSFCKWVGGCRDGPVHRSPYSIKAAARAEWSIFSSIGLSGRFPTRAIVERPEPMVASTSRRFPDHRHLPAPFAEPSRRPSSLTRLTVQRD